MPIEIDEDSLYYFTAKSDDKYHTVFAGWLRLDLIKAFQQIDGVGSFAHIRLVLGENTFIANVGAPLYLLNYENDDIFEFAENNDELDLYPSGELPDELDMDPVIDYPRCFNAGVEPLIEFKLFNKFWAQKNGIWVELDV